MVLTQKKPDTSPGTLSALGHQVLDNNYPQLLDGDCIKELKSLQEESVHLVIADPPYFLDGLDSEWQKGRLTGKSNRGVVGGLPVGMKFDPKQGKELQAFIGKVGIQLIRVMRPGSFALWFSQPRLVHRLAVGLEDVGFEIRDMYAWHFTRRAQFKAFSMNHFVDRMNISQTDKIRMKDTLEGRKTPQLRPQFECIVLTQKPREGTMVSNWLQHHTGLIDSNATLDGRAPSTVMTVEKPEKARYNGHLTVKPVKLVEHMIRLFSKEHQTVLDPFLGSGTTAVAALRTKRKCIGIEIDPDYMKIAKKRIEDELK